MRSVKIPLKYVIITEHSYYPFQKLTEIQYINITVDEKRKINKQRNVGDIT